MGQQNQRVARKRNLSASGVRPLESRLLLSGLMVQGSRPGLAPEIRILDADTGAERLRFAPFGPSKTGGVRVALGDFDGDGSLDIAATTGPMANPVIKLFRSTDGGLIGRIELPRALAGSAASIAAGDVSGDGLADVVVAPGQGTPRIRVYQGRGGQLLGSFRADTSEERGRWNGARVAVGDLNGDGHADIAATPVLGRSSVGVFSGKDFVSLARFRSFAGASGGRGDIAVADVDGDRRLDVVAANSRGRAAIVKAFGGTSGMSLGTVTVAGAAAPNGVRIAAVNVGGRGADELAITPSRGAAGTVVLAASSWRTVVAGVGSPTVAYRLPSSSNGAFLAGDSSVAMATPAIAVNQIEPPLSQALPVLDRLAYFDRTSGTFVPVLANDPRLVGKDITVIAHGWAPGYEAWVNHEATVNGRVLKWWETFPGQPGYDADWARLHPQDPDSVFLLQGIAASTIFGTTTVSTTGLSQTISNRALLGTPGPADTNAVVLAYSWIDDSATPDWDFLTAKIPEESYRSEALTTLNGRRMASALGQAIGTSVTGKIQLVGHSHGSKVVSVASASAQAAGLPIAQVTVLDSPEDDVTVAGDAANYNWFFLKELQGLNRSTPGGVFVDNVISEFGVPYSGITLSNGEGANLTQIVDVGLTPDAFYSVDLGDRHSYAAAWYAGSGEPAVTFGQKVGQYWSPLLPANSGGANPVAGLPSYAELNWSEFSYPADQQYVLNPQSGPPTSTISFETLSTPSVSLTQDGTMISSLPVSVQAPYYGQSGIAFDYQFANFQPGDRLIILADGKPAFVMDAALIGTARTQATMSLYSLPFESHALTFVLTSTASNTTSTVTVSNFRTFYQPVFNV